MVKIIQFKDGLNIFKIYSYIMFYRVVGHFGAEFFAFVCSSRFCVGKS